MPKLIRIVIQLPEELKVQLDGLKQQGYTTSGFIRAVLERELQKPEFRPLHENGNSHRNGQGKATVKGRV
jgi:metal-responsive CopG/Arc/MetJ family transcriptional regulator